MSVSCKFIRPVRHNLGACLLTDTGGARVGRPFTPNWPMASRNCRSNWVVCPPLSRLRTSGVIFGISRPTTRGNRRKHPGPARGGDYFCVREGPWATWDVAPHPEAGLDEGPGSFRRPVPCAQRPSEDAFGRSAMIKARGEPPVSEWVDDYFGEPLQALSWGRISAFGHVLVWVVIQFTHFGHSRGKMVTL